MNDLILRWNVGKEVVCGLSGGIMGDRIIPNEYVAIMVQEVFIAESMIVNPLNSKANVQLGTILFWSAKF